MKIKILTTLLLAAFILTGCMVPMHYSPVIAPAGSAFDFTTVPVDINFEGNDTGSKTGSSNSFSLFGLVAFGNAGVRKAALNGNIQVVKHIDCKVINVLGIYRGYVTIVYGD